MIINIDSINNIYIVDVYKNEISFINNTIEIIIGDYNISSDNKIELDIIISLTN